MNIHLILKSHVFRVDLFLNFEYRQVNVHITDLSAVAAAAWWDEDNTGLFFPEIKCGTKAEK